MASHDYDAIFLTDTPHYPDWVRGYGAHRLATHLRSYGYRVLVIDFMSGLGYDTWKEICELAIGPSTKIVGFSTTWWPFKDRNGASIVNLNTNYVDPVSDENKKELASQARVFTEAVLHKTDVIKQWTDIIKKINPKTKIVIGGAKLDWYQDFPADHFISGMGEVQILDLLNEPRRIWPKLINHDTHATSRDWGWRTCYTSYNEIDRIRSDEILSLETARGCRFKCIYCQFPLVGQKKVADYIKTEETLYKELLENYERWGTTKYWLVDDTFNDTTEKVQHVLNVVRRLPFQPIFRIYARLDVLAMNPEQISMLYEIGVRSVFFGIESFHPETAKIIGKGMNQEKRKKTLYDARAAWGNDVHIGGGYIIGLPKEGYEHAKQQFEWFMDPDCPVQYINFFPLVINPEGSYPNHPMSEIDKNYQKYGYDIPDLKNHHYWVKDDGTDIKSFARAFEIMREFNVAMEEKNRKTPIQDMIKYGDGNSIRDAEREYFRPMIEDLRNTLPPDNQ